MKKRLLILILTILCMAAFTGCAKVIELDAQQNDIVAEYAAGVLIRNSYSYKLKYPQELLTEKPTEGETESGTASEEATTGPEEETKPGQNSQLAKALGIDPVEITYSSYKIVDEYPDDPEAILTFSPQKGCKFVVLEFVLHNPTEEAVTLSTAERGIIMKAEINGSRYNNYANLMLNDITNLKNIVVEPGKDYEGIVVFMAEEKDVSKIDSFTLLMKIKDVNTEILKIK